MAPFELRPNDHVEQRLAIMAIVTAAALAFLPAVFAESIGRMGAVFPAAETAAVAGAVLTAYLLAALRRMEDDEKLAWLVPAFLGAAVVAALRATAMPAYAPGGGPFHIPPDNHFALGLVSRFAIPVFALAALFGLAPQIRRAATALYTACILIVLLVPLPTLVDTAERYTFAANAAAGVAAALAAVATWRWIVAAGRRPHSAELWVGISLFLGAWCAFVWFLVDARFSSRWWSSVLLEAAMLVVPAIGLTVSYVRFGTRLASYFERRERQLEAQIGLMEAAIAGDGGPQQPADRSAVLSMMERRAYHVVFQPIVDLDTGRAVGLEALTRFTDEPVRGPHEWLQEAERSALREDLELAICADVVQTLDSIPSGLFVSINLSPATVHSAGIAAILKTARVERLVIELTENAVIDDYDELLAAIETVRTLGLRVAIDDVGAGYATLRHVLRLRPDVIKLDMTLVAGVDIDPVQRSLAAALQRFAGDTGSVLVAEGVEAASQMLALQAIGVKIAQGYHFGRPSPLDVLMERHAALLGVAS